MKYNSKIVVAWFAEHGIYAVPEYQFAAGRKWRFDFALQKNMKHEFTSDYWIELSKIALEVEGGVWTGGRHTRGSGFVKDMEKYNRAAVLGWRVLRCVPDDLCTMETVEMIKAAI